MRRLVLIGLLVAFLACRGSDPEDSAEGPAGGHAKEAVQGQLGDQPESAQPAGKKPGRDTVDRQAGHESAREVEEPLGSKQDTPLESSPETPLAPPTVDELIALIKEAEFSFPNYDFLYQLKDGYTGAVLGSHYKYSCTHTETGAEIELRRNVVTFLGMNAPGPRYLLVASHEPKDRRALLQLAGQISTGLQEACKACLDKYELTRRVSEKTVEKLRVSVSEEGIFVESIPGLGQDGRAGLNRSQQGEQTLGHTDRLAPDKPLTDGRSQDEGDPRAQGKNEGAGSQPGKETADGSHDAPVDRNTKSSQGQGATHVGSGNQRAGQPARGRLRTWVSADGNYSVEASFVDFSEGRVRLRKADGSTVTVPIERLTRFDQDWARQSACALFPVGGEKGPCYIDNTGKVVMQFAGVKPFSEGLAAVRAQKDGKWGYVNQRGEMVVKPQFDKAGRFSEGMARVIVDGKCGYINSAGTIVIEPQFDEEPDVHAYWAIAWSAPAPDPTRREFGEFSEGLAAVRRGKTFAYVDKSGKIVFEMQNIRFAREFSTGLALVWTNDSRSEKGRGGFVDRTGRFVVKPQFIAARSFREGLAAVKAKDKKCYFIDRTGAVAIEAVTVDGKQMEFTEPRSFSEGLAGVRVGESPGKYAFIDKRGNAVIQPQFTTCAGFSGGLAPVCNVYTLGFLSTAKFGFVDKTGKMVIEKKLDRADPFLPGGLAEVTLVQELSRTINPSAIGGFDRVHESRTDLIDDTGKTVWKGVPTQY